MKLAHSSPAAGHFAEARTLDTLRQRVTWPRITSDVKEACRSCPTCQRSAPTTMKRAPLHSLPIIRTPFERVAMDIFGPLKRTKSGYKYLLVIMDYATKWPEAFPLRNVTTESVVECLIELTARLGVPKEVLTDNGTNFVSRTMKKFCALAGIQQIRPSPYHPQTDGMVERFNATMKHLLRKLTQKNTVDWDQCIPYLLWAYRGTTHKSTGYSPFELLYGRPMRTPLDELIELWTVKDEESGREVIEYLRLLREKMALVRDIAYTNEVQQKKEQKYYHDKKAVPRQFEVGDYVLVFRPRKENKLCNEWRGPVIVTNKITDVTYEVELDHGQKRTFHVNGMKEWKSPVPAVFLSVDDVLEEDATEEEEKQNTNNLTYCQEQQLQKLKEKFADVISDDPGRTDLVEHKIETEDASPIRLPPYRLPHAAHEYLRKEVKSLLTMGIIVPSKSPWAAPVVLVPKKDGSKRLCVDYRKLNLTQHAFEWLKNSLSNYPILSTPIWSKPFILQTDASDTGIGFVLSQKDELGDEHPIAYGSRKLLARETHYSTIEKEALAIVEGTRHFRVYLEGIPFTIETDHNPLTHMARLKDSHGRLARWALAMQPYRNTVVHKPGREHLNADGLSREHGSHQEEWGMSGNPILTGEKGGPQQPLHLVTSLPDHKYKLGSPTHQDTGKPRHVKGADWSEGEGYHGNQVT